jgi:hypothetical protein
MGHKQLPSAKQIAYVRKLVELGRSPDAVAISLEVLRETTYKALG